MDKIIKLEKSVEIYGDIVNIKKDYYYINNIPYLVLTEDECYIKIKEILFSGLIVPYFINNIEKLEDTLRPYSEKLNYFVDKNTYLVNLQTVLSEIDRESALSILLDLIIEKDLALQHILEIQNYDYYKFFTETTNMIKLSNGLILIEAII